MRILVLFCTSKSGIKRFFGGSIEILDKVPFQHAALLYSDDRMTRVVESIIPISRDIAYEEWLNHYTIVEAYEMPELTPSAVQVFIKPLVGKPYSVFQLLLISISNYWGHFKTFFKTDVNGSQTLICSELVAEFLESSYDVSFDELQDFISLKDLREKVRTIGVKRIG